MTHMIVAAGGVSRVSTGAHEHMNCTQKPFSLSKVVCGFALAYETPVHTICFGCAEDFFSRRSPAHVYLVGQNLANQAPFEGLEMSNYSGALAETLWESIDEPAEASDDRPEVRPPGVTRSLAGQRPISEESCPMD